MEVIHPTSHFLNITELLNIQVYGVLFKNQPLYYNQLAAAEAHTHHLSKRHQASLD